jgi:hypothetical protein
MRKIESKLTVLFEGQFWVGVYERVADGKLEVCKITFGAEPKDYEVYDFFLQNWNKLRFSPPVQADAPQGGKVNPKRMRRAIQKQIESEGVGTRSQQALKLQQEERKVSQKEQNRRQKDDEKQRQFQLRQQKHKEKHRGR